MIRETADFVKSYPVSSLRDIAYYKMAVALMEQKKFKEAAGVFKTVMDEFPNSPVLAESIYGAAVSLENDSQPKEAIVYCEKLVSRFPTHNLSKEIWPRLAYLYIQTKN